MDTTECNASSTSLWVNAWWTVLKEKVSKIWDLIPYNSTLAALSTFSLHQSSMSREARYFKRCCCKQALHEMEKKSFEVGN